MAMEIELKAWIKNPEETKTKLSKLAVFKGSFEKNDYFYSPGSQSETGENSGYGVRIRNEIFTSPDGITKENNIITYKIKEIRNGIEVNEEHEFETSSGQAFREFLLYLGCKERNINKRKKGNSYDNNGMTIEVTEVAGLGWFAELEILTPDKDEDKIDNVKERLLTFLDKLEIPRDSIESRSYIAMLAQL